jgi:hypothetical protein
MIPFPVGAIDFARALNEANLPDTAVVSVPGGFVPNLEGGGAYTSPTTFTFPCRTWPLSPREIEAMVAEQLREPGLEGLAMPVGQALPADATLTVTRGETGAVTAYEVKARVPDPTYAMTSRAIIKRTSAPDTGEPMDLVFDGGPWQ